MCVCVGGGLTGERLFIVFPAQVAPKRDGFSINGRNGRFRGPTEGSLDSRIVRVRENTNRGPFCVVVLRFNDESVVRLFFLRSLTPC